MKLFNQLVHSIIMNISHNTGFFTGKGRQIYSDMTARMMHCLWVLAAVILPFVCVHIGNQYCLLAHFLFEKKCRYDCSAIEREFDYVDELDRSGHLQKVVGVLGELFEWKTVCSRNNCSAGNCSV